MVERRLRATVPPRERHSTGDRPLPRSMQRLDRSATWKTGGNMRGGGALETGPRSLPAIFSPSRACIKCAKTPPTPSLSPPRAIRLLFTSLSPTFLRSSYLRFSGLTPSAALSPTSRTPLPFRRCQRHPFAERATFCTPVGLIPSTVGMEKSIKRTYRGVIDTRLLHCARLKEKNAGASSMGGVHTHPN